MLLKDYISNINKKFGNVFFSGISFDSSKVKKNDIFFAIKGNRIDGNNFIPIAIQRGSKIIVSEKKINEYEKTKSDLENEMLGNQFYDIKNALRIKDANTDLKKIIQLLKQEETVWEKIIEEIENFDK